MRFYSKKIIYACIVLASFFVHSCSGGNTKDKQSKAIQPDTAVVLVDTNMNKSTYQLDPSFIWNIAYGGTNTDVPHDIVSTSDSGCIFLLWRVRKINKVDDVSERREWAIVRFDKYGTLVWDKVLPASEFGDYYTSMALFNEALLLHSHSKDSSYLTTCNLSNGDILYQSSIKQCKSLFLHVSRINKIYVVGYGKNSPFISEISQDGEKKSETFFENEQWNEINSITDDSLGNLYFTGRSGKFNNEGVWIGAVDKDCSLLWSKRNLLPDDYYAGECIYLTSDNSLLVTGSYWSKEVREFNLFVAKFNITGGEIWRKVESGNNNDMRKSAVEYNGNYYILANVKADNFGGEAQIYSITTEGQIQKNLFLKHVYGKSISKNIMGNSFFLLGQAYAFQVYGPGETDVYLSSLDYAGNINNDTRSFNIDAENVFNGIDLSNLKEVQKFIQLYRFDRYENGYSFNLLFNPKDETSGEVLFSTHVLPKGGSPQFLSQNAYNYSIESTGEKESLNFKTSLGETAISLTSDGTVIMHDSERNQTYYFHKSVR